MTLKEQIRFLEAESRALLGIEIEVHKRREIISKQLDRLKDEEALKKVRGEQCKTTKE